jgi:hypothetical protein
MPETGGETVLKKAVLVAKAKRDERLFSAGDVGRD